MCIYFDFDTANAFRCCAEWHDVLDRNNGEILVVVSYIPWSLYRNRGSLGRRLQVGVITNVKRKQMKALVPKISQHSWDVVIQTIGDPQSRECRVQDVTRIKQTRHGIMLSGTNHAPESLRSTHLLSRSN